MTLSYGGVYLAQTDPEVESWVAGNIPLHREVFDVPVGGLGWPGKDRTAWSWFYTTPPPPIRLNRLYWPCWGATRFAVFYGLATDSMLASIRPLVYGASYNAYNALALAMSDGRSGRSISTNLYMLPPKPLSQISGSNGFSLLTLVSARYFFWERSASITVTGGTTTWANLFSSIASALSITLTTDTINSAYLKPSVDLTSRYEMIPYLLDSACASVGQRFVEKTDGTFVTQNPLTAKTSQDAQLTSWSKQAGGLYNFVAGA